MGLVAEIVFFSLYALLRCVLAFSEEDDNQITENNNWLQSLEAQTDFPSVLVNWLNTTEDEEEGGFDFNEDGDLFVEESFISPGMTNGTAKGKGRTCYLLFGFRVEEESTRRFFFKNWKEVFKSNEFTTMTRTLFSYVNYPLSKYQAKQMIPTG